MPINFSINFFKILWILVCIQASYSSPIGVRSGCGLLFCCDETVRIIPAARKRDRFRSPSDAGRKPPVCLASRHLARAAEAASDRSSDRPVGITGFGVSLVSVQKGKTNDRCYAKHIEQ